VTEDDTPTDDDAPPEAIDPDGEDEAPSPVPSWLGAIGQMTAALLVVIALSSIGVARPSGGCCREGRPRWPSRCRPKREPPP
jgi:hypothetical protein